jgi:predicted metalloprotease
VAGGGIGAVILALVITLLGGNPDDVLQDVGGSAPPPTAADDTLAQFVSVVLADTEEAWQAVFQEEFGRPYSEPTLVLFSGSVQSACGFAQAAMGPFYCPLDQQVYIDLSFYHDLRNQLGAPGDFAQAYVIAHEVGHHVQNLLGISEEVHANRQRLSGPEGNALSVRQELQADCFAGVWANRAQQMWGVLEPGDVEEALGAASAVGDDRLQQASQGQVVPESFTHGSSAQRMSWFDRGYRSGSPRDCDTFSARNV